VADLPVYLSIDIDVLDPSLRRARDAGGGRAQQPGTAARAARPDQPQPGQRDLVEVSPAYDHAEITSLPAATVIFDVVTLLGRKS
jgi:agmatinase